MLLFADIAGRVKYCSMAKMVAVCKSKRKGTKKKAVAEGIPNEDYGLALDNRTGVLEGV